ncbi:putative zinc metalloprotease egy1, chloroplastic [Trifolium repens]|nr:putative zinc metalloprotease egy1, chloroplastic [Trifolium repens]
MTDKTRSWQRLQGMAPWFCEAWYDHHQNSMIVADCQDIQSSSYPKLQIQTRLFKEVRHFLAAFPKQVKLSIPFFIPHITLGSFGAITQF